MTQNQTDKKIINLKFKVILNRNSIFPTHALVFCIRWSNLELAFVTEGKIKIRKVLK
jgi:hypothetical protein